MPLVEARVEVRGEALLQVRGEGLSEVIRALSLGRNDVGYGDLAPRTFVQTPSAASILAKKS